MVINAVVLQCLRKDIRGREEGIDPQDRIRRFIKGSEQAVCNGLSVILLPHGDELSRAGIPDFIPLFPLRQSLEQFPAPAGNLAQHAVDKTRGMPLLQRFRTADRLIDGFMKGKVK